MQRETAAHGHVHASQTWLHPCLRQWRHARPAPQLGWLQTRAPPRGRCEHAPHATACSIYLPPSCCPPILACIQSKPNQPEQTSLQRFVNPQAHVCTHTCTHTYTHTHTHTHTRVLPPELPLFNRMRSSKGLELGQLLLCFEQRLFESTAHNKTWQCEHVRKERKKERKEKEGKKEGKKREGGEGK